MRKVLLVLLVLLVVPEGAVGQPYFSTGFGLNTAPELESLRSGMAIPQTICDEYINPRYAELPECVGPGSSHAWTSVFDRAAGVLGGTAVGYRAGRRFRVEAEYFYRDSPYDQTSPILGASGETSERIAGEVARARERVYSLTSHNLFGNIYVDFDTGSRFTPYLGVGVGAGFTELDIGRVLARHLDPAAITSVPDHVPNAEEVRRNLAGTTTTFHTTETDIMRAYQVIFGTDLVLADAVSISFKGRWVRHGTFQASGVLDQLRSHPPNYRRDGSLPVTSQRTVEGLQMLGVTVELKYYF